MAVLQEFDLRDLSTVRQLAEGIALYLAGSRRSSNNEVIRSLDAAQRAEFGQIIGQMKLDEEFRGIVQMLLDRRHQNDMALFRLGGDILRYLEGGRSGSSVGAAGMAKPAYVASSTLHSSSSKIGRAAILRNARPRSQRRAHMEDDEDFASQLQEEEYQQDKDVIEERFDDDAQGHDATFVKDYDYDTEIACDLTTINRGSAAPGVPKPSYYKIVIPLRKKVLNASGGHDAADSLMFDWLEDHDEPSWAAGTLYKMNQWRSQIFRRYLSNKGVTRGNWLVSEQQLIIDLLKAQLEDTDKPPQGKPKWRRLTNDYNNRMWKCIQPKGSRLVQEGAKGNARTDGDRPAPWRTSPAIQGIVMKDTWKELVGPILQAAKERRDRYLEKQQLPDDYKSDFSKDDKEFPVPNEAPKTSQESKAGVRTRKNARKAERVVSTKSKKEVVELESEEDEVVEEEEEEVEEPPLKKRKPDDGPETKARQVIRRPERIPVTRRKKFEDTEVEEEEEQEEAEEPARKKRKEGYGASKYSENKRRGPDRNSDNDEGKSAPIRRDHFAHAY